MLRKKSVKKMNQILLAILFLLIIFGLFFYVFFRLWQMVPLEKPVLIGATVLLVSSMVLGFTGGYFLPSPIANFLYYFGMTVLFVTLYLFLIFVVFDVLRLIFPAQLQQILVGNWKTFAILAIALTAFFTYAHLNYRNVVRKDVTIAINKEISPLRIVAISDLHLGYGVSSAKLDRWITLINEAEPDIVVMVGDIVDNPTSFRPIKNRDFATRLRKINARYGVFASLGNHEYIAGIYRTLAFLKDAGITVLRDTAILINDEFYLIGRDDLYNPKRKTIAELLQNLDTTKPLILLDHQPFNLNEAEKNGIDLQISGHTHRGQMWPATWIAEKIFEVAHGHLQRGNTHIFVTSGIGIWGGKFRLGTQSEYVVIELETRR